MNLSYLHLTASGGLRLARHLLASGPGSLCELAGHGEAPPDRSPSVVRLLASCRLRQVGADRLDPMLSGFSIRP